MTSRGIFFEEDDARAVARQLEADGYDGWLDADDAAPGPGPAVPLDLPAAPKRIKRTP